MDEAATTDTFRIGHGRAGDGKAGALPRVHWVRALSRDAGNSYGYSHLHKRIDAAVQHDEEAPVALHCCTTDKFQPVPGKRNALFTMWESPDVTRHAVEAMAAADLVIVPSEFCRTTALPWTTTPIEVVHLGVDVERWRYVRRRWPEPGQPFRWLWCAAPNPRKGWGMVGHVWGLAGFANDPRVELYLKTSAPDTDRIERRGNMVVDVRSLPIDELVALYESAHGFLYPSMGEGFGLTAGEAMASGLPLVSTAVTGHADFVNEHVAWTIGHEWQRVPAAGDEHESTAETGDYRVAVPIQPDLLGAMLRVMGDYRTATEKARRASKLIRSRFTWRRFSQRLADVLRRA